MIHSSELSLGLDPDLKKNQEYDVKMTHIWVGFTHRQPRLYLYSVQRITHSDSTCPCLFSEKRQLQGELIENEIDQSIAGFFNATLYPKSREECLFKADLRDLKKKMFTYIEAESNPHISLGFWLKIKVKIKRQLTLNLIIFARFNYPLTYYAHTISC